MQPSELPPEDVSAEEIRDPRLRRYWRTYNRPYVGCGVLWTALVLLLIYWLLSFLFPSLIPSVY